MNKDMHQEKRLKELDVFLKQASPCVHTVYSVFAGTQVCMECLLDRLNFIPLVTIKLTPFITSLVV